MLHFTKPSNLEEIKFVSSKIKILPEQVINQIAAGEVIERPASVVKELVENAIDAKSSRIEIELWDAGKQKISVRDNGIGMTTEEAHLCVERHATSKIKCLDDLFKVKSLGFRGEALPSISSVSKLTLTTKTADLDAIRLSFEGGKKIKEEIVGAPCGTEVVIQDLFFNTPARLKFLKSKGTELSYCSEIISQLSMVNPFISFRLTHQGREVFHFAKASSLLERLLAVLKEEKETFIPLVNQHGEWTLDAFCGVAHVTTHSSTSCVMFVNGRPVRDRTLLHAVSSAYETLIPHGQYPKVILFLKTEGGDVDVNVHPTKKEVRFKDTHFIHSFVENSIREVLRPRHSEPFSSHSEQKNVILSPKGEGSPESYFSFYPPDFRIHETQIAFDSKGYFENLRFIGQIKSSYLLCEDKEELVFIDQHAAHERVAFEKLKAQYNSQTIKEQYLLIPLALELTSEETVLMEELGKNLSKFGFEIEPFGKTTFVVKAVPQELHDKITPMLIQSMLLELKDVPKSLMGQEWVNKILSTIACHSARTAHEKLEREEIFALLKALDRVTSAPHCPHGRPFTFKVPISEIEKKFLR